MPTRYQVCHELRQCTNGRDEVLCRALSGPLAVTQNWKLVQLCRLIIQELPEE